MADLVKKTIGNAKGHPVAAALILGAIVLGGLANAGRAIEELGALWASWTSTPPRLESTWQGTWQTRRGYKFSFVMKLDVLEDGTADGSIRWHLLETPPDSHLADRIDSEGTEFVSGRYDRQSGVALLDGYQVDDPTLLALDSYQFRIEGAEFVGMTRDNDGSWAAEAGGRVIVTERR